MAYEFITEMDHYEANPLKRGDHVHFIGNENFIAIDDTYVWAIMAHMMVQLVIEHPDGHPKSSFIKDYLAGKFPDGFEAIHSSQLRDGLKYIYANPSELVKWE